MPSARVRRLTSVIALRSGCGFMLRTSRSSRVRPLANIEITCGMAKRPISAGMMLMPPASEEWKIKRCVPKMSSKPMVEIQRPIHPASNPLMTELLPKVPMTVTPRIAIQKLSLGPKTKAHLARIGVAKISRSTPATPPKSEAKNDNCKARLPSPLRAIVWPSNVVAILAGAPGIFSKMALTAPPATVEVYSAPSKISP